MARSPRFTIALIGAALITSTLALAVAPSAAAAPNVGGVTLAGDGFSVGLANQVQILTNEGPRTRYGYAGPYVEGGPMYGAFGNGTLNTYFGSKGDANVYFLARGGFVKFTGGDCGAGTYYQRSRVTLTGLGGTTKDIWAFWDGDATTSTAQWEDARCDPLR